MSDTVIKVENLSKKYLIKHGHARSREDGLRHVIQDAVSAPWRSLRSKFAKPGADVQDQVQRSSEGEFWALKEVSFEIKRGEVVGIIGRNGAGKSTLLKILSRITEPTSGRIGIKGRVASLLEVGTGFHPELSGRENIYLNGAILGMSRAEVKRKFDEIVDFSGVEKFLDTPVKRYSSGMYVRLAFAVAAHLEPEILIIDEVLAVGDAEFQKKCIGKMQEVASGGRTVLFVSHHLHSIRNLCGTGILLRHGSIVSTGPIQRCMDYYCGFSTVDRYEVTYSADGDMPRIIRLAMDQQKASEGTLDIEIEYIASHPDFSPVPGLVVNSLAGDPVYGSNTRMHPPAEKPERNRAGTIKFQCFNIPLLPGRYKISVWLGDWQQNYDAKIDALEFTLRDGVRSSLTPPETKIGYINVPAIWSV